MSRVPKSETKITKLSRPYGDIARRHVDDGYYDIGVAYTTDGTVVVYSEVHKDTGKDRTHLQMTRNGKKFDREFDRAYSPRYLVTLAANFAYGAKIRLP